MKHPMQFVHVDANGVTRFVGNEIVRYLIDNAYDKFGHRWGMNEIASAGFSDEDREQLAQLIGYSVSGFGDLSYASAEAIETASRMESGKSPEQARIEALESMLNEVRAGLRIAVPAVFMIHPDDLT